MAHIYVKSLVKTGLLFILIGLLPLNTYARKHHHMKSKASEPDPVCMKACLEHDYPKPTCEKDCTDPSKAH